MRRLILSQETAIEIKKNGEEGVEQVKI